LTSYASPEAEAVTQKSLTRENNKSYTIFNFLNLEGTGNLRGHTVERRRRYKVVTLRIW
jgi:hypothetical protein